ncbi:c-type cytochrome [Sphingobium yanoikuyae]|uniref:c-type cytochrome n=1 Tax=Sphingobium yanoikuyae TaxID=13690 RepID=UPI003F05E610
MMRRNGPFWAVAGVMGLGLTALVACARPDGGEKASAATAEPSAAAMSPGEKLYRRECGFCHTGHNTGTIMLERRLGKGQGELANRTDLDADYVVSVARNGLMSMPAISRVEVTDEELKLIADYLARNSKPEDAAK